MDSIPKPRFRSREAALRFYFRARELLGGSVPCPLEIQDEMPPGMSRGGGILGDFAVVGSCFHKLDDFQVWLMAEMYGPTRFGARQRTVGRALRAARTRFPERRITMRDVSRIRRATLELLRHRLAVTGLITPLPGTQAGMDMRAPRAAGARNGAP
jgi:hypothetical protein